jgi:hypothetical protein
VRERERAGERERDRKGEREKERERERGRCDLQECSSESHIKQRILRQIIILGDKMTKRRA